MEYYGYAGKILHVDLTTGRVITEALDLALVKKFIGGWGVNNRLAYDLLKPDIEPLSPDNVIIIGVGPLCGTLAPLTAKVSATMKLPAQTSKLEGKYSVVSGVGGTRRFGAMLKNAGYDHLVITGRTQRPSYLKIIDDDVEICDASDLWGKDVYQATDELTDRHKGATGKCGVWAIGRAGENLVTWAHGFVDKQNSLGRCGGAVLGSKNLKAIVTLGTKGVKIADSKRFMGLVDAVHQELHRWPELKDIPFPDANTHGGGIISDDYPVEIYSKTKGVGSACMACMVGCRPSYHIRDGRFAGQSTPRAIFEIIRNLGRRLRIKDYREMIILVDLINRSGLDLNTALRMIYFLTRLYERGVISSAETGGLVLKRGDFEAYAKLVEIIANREDIGDIAAEGWHPLAQKVKVDASEDFSDGCAITKGIDTLLDARVSGLSPSLFAAVVRPAGGREVIQDTYLPRGEDLSQDTYWPEFRRTLKDVRQGCQKMGMTEEEINRIFTSLDFNSGRLEKHAEDVQAVCDSVGVCTLGYHLGWPMRNVPRICAFYSAATGFEVTPEELKKSGERAWNVERILNVREGFTREDDVFPAVWVQNIDTPVMGDKYLSDWFGKRITKEDLNKMLDDYYEERGWDIKKGVPTKQKLTQLELQELL